MDNGGKKGSGNDYGGGGRDGGGQEEKGGDKGDFSSGGEYCGVGEGREGGEGAPRESGNFGGSRGGMPQKAVPGTGHPGAAMFCHFPVEQIDGTPGGSPRGVPDLPLWRATDPCSAEFLCRSPGESPGALSSPPRGLTVSLFPARSFGWPPDERRAEGSQDFFREAITSSFPVGSVSRPQGDPPSVPAASSRGPASSPLASEGSCVALCVPPPLSSCSTRGSEPAGFPAPAGSFGRPEDGGDSGPLSPLDGTVTKSPLSSEEDWDGLLPSGPASAASATTSRGSVPNSLPVGDNFCVTPDGPKPSTDCSAPSRSPAASGFPVGALGGSSGRPPSAFRNRTGGREPPCGSDTRPEPPESIALMMARTFITTLFCVSLFGPSTGPSPHPSRPTANSSSAGGMSGQRSKTVTSAGPAVDMFASKKGRCGTKFEDQGESKRGGGREGRIEGGGRGARDKEDKAEEFGRERSDQEGVRTHARARQAGDLTRGEESRTDCKGSAATKKARRAGEESQLQRLEDEQNGKREHEGCGATAHSGNANDLSDTGDGAGIASSGGEVGSGNHGGRYRNQRREKKSGGVGGDKDDASSGRSFGEKNKKRRVLSPAEKSTLVNLSWDAFILQLSEFNKISSNDGASGNLLLNRAERYTLLGSSTASPLVSDAMEEHREDDNNREEGAEDNDQSVSKGLNDRTVTTGTDEVGGEVGSRHVESSNAFSQTLFTAVDGESETYNETVRGEFVVAVAAAAECRNKRDETFQDEVRDATGSIIIHSDSTDILMSADSPNSSYLIFDKPGLDEDVRVGDLNERDEEKVGWRGDASLLGTGGDSEGGGGGGEKLMAAHWVPYSASSPGNGAFARKGMETKAIQSSIDTTPPEGGLNCCATAIGTQLGVGVYESSGVCAEYGEGIEARRPNVASTIAHKTLAGREIGEPKAKTYPGGGRDDASSDPFESSSGRKSTKLVSQRARDQCITQGGAATASAYTELIGQGRAGNEPRTCSERERVGDRSETKDGFPLAEGYHSTPTAIPASISNIGTGEGPPTIAPTFEGPNSDEADVYDISDGSASTGTPEGTVEGSESVGLYADTPDDERGPPGRSAADSADRKDEIPTGRGEGEEQVSPATADGCIHGKGRDQSMVTEAAKPTPVVDLGGVVDQASPGGGLALLTSFPGGALSDDYPFFRDNVESLQGEVIDDENVCSAESDLRQNVAIFGADARRLVEETAVGRSTRQEEAGPGTPGHRGVKTSPHIVVSYEEPRTRNKACQTRW